MGDGTPDVLNARSPALNYRAPHPQLELMMTPYVNGEISHWMKASGSVDQQDGPRAAGRRAGALPDEEQDFVIVGGGLTGLWAAYYAAAEQPDAKITVLEAEEVGYGASGRNGGWLSPLIPGNRGVYAKAARRRGQDGAAAIASFQRAMETAIDDTLRVLEDEGINADQHRGGHLRVATTPAAMKRLEATHTADLAHGYYAQDLELLDADAVRKRINISPALGGLLTRTTARVDPAKLVHGLAAAVENKGARILEGTRATRITPHAVTTSRGIVRGKTILTCVEAYSGQIDSDARGLDARDVIPVNSSMIVTQQLPDSAWEQVGWQGYECLGDAAHTFVYAQRTADGRIAIGGRGTPYAFNSGTPGLGTVDARTVRTLHERLQLFFPGVQFEVEHAWRGAIGVTRDWCAGITFDPATRIGVVRGFAGHGVTATHLAARTLIDRAAGRETPLTQLPWNDHDSGRWEPEPLRWIGVHGMYRLFGIADRWEESRHSQNTSLIARFGSRLAGLE
ncbi:NAD(P)/FAD-dependent oxidoreductase [Streptomyces longhuiensis]|uniref:NAD(P)/FAD-dependent oxidoreductase n=1 Tax=Streptomyces longhuiensis TaxID=2880933 RepID=UPI001D09B10A|nr:FAD-dependent oxidoreductase [Streptomyces longhuiensis]UDM04499.1 FAD-binding oxidoreductase [Streptomyces longhuiensis]